MKIFRSEMNIAFDVDNTLIMWDEFSNVKDESRIEIKDPYGEGVFYLRPHGQHILLLKQHKRRGFGIIVWSAAGCLWAQAVVEALKLEEYVDLILTKNVKHVDDKELMEDIIGSRIYLPEMVEIWKKIEEYPNYEISTVGNIRKLFNNKNEYYYPIINDVNGYKQVKLNKNGKTYHELLHRLVARAFIPNPEKLNIVHHKNAIRSDNKVSNLEWTTQKENLKKRKNIGCKRGGDKSNSKLNETQAIEIYNLCLEKKLRKNEIAKLYNVHPQTVHHIAIKKRWKHIHNDE